MRMIYWPVSCRLLTPGHIKCIEYLREQGFVIIGLLTKKAMKGYKDELVPFEDRKFLLEAFTKDLPNIVVVAQHTLNPKENILKYRCDTIASGDGFEKTEQEVIDELVIEPLLIKLKGEIKKKYSSSKIWKKTKKA